MRVLPPAILFSSDSKRQAYNPFTTFFDYKRRDSTRWSRSGQMSCVKFDGRFLLRKLTHSLGAPVAQLDRASDYGSEG